MRKRAESPRTRRVKPSAQASGRGTQLQWRSRFYRHRYDLKKGTHGNIHLQRSWDKYGENKFSFEITEIIEPEKIKEREQFYLDNEDKTKMYNIGLQASGGDNITNNPNYETIVSNITKGVRKRYANMTLEQKIAYSKRMSGENNPNFGNKDGWSDEQKRKASIRMSERKVSTETRKKMSDFQKELWKNESYKERISANRKGNGNAFYGKRHNLETKQILAEKTKERISRMTDAEKLKWREKISQNSPVKRQVSIEGVI
jgi:group I intron endonuclease